MENGTIHQKQPTGKQRIKTAQDGFFKIRSARSRNYKPGSKPLRDLPSANASSILEDVPAEYVKAINQNQCIQQVP
jgi:hypothetical protein